mmetsp:Transcript_1071/g.2226  ORF Transcript_1071/g.2226 Transcript_1071/m.2226 type:complete len:213 (+) Transcript_1071:682-1320(+)
MLLGESEGSLLRSWCLPDHLRPPCSGQADEQKDPCAVMVLRCQRDCTLLGSGGTRPVLSSHWSRLSVLRPPGGPRSACRGAPREGMGTPPKRCRSSVCRVGESRPQVSGREEGRETAVCDNHRGGGHRPHKDSSMDHGQVRSGDLRGSRPHCRQGPSRRADGCERKSQKRPLHRRRPEGRPRNSRIRGQVSRTSPGCLKKWRESEGVTERKP